MRRLPLFLLAVSLAGLACNSTGKKPAAQTKPTGATESTPFWSEDLPSKANIAKDNQTPRMEGLLAGTLIDAYDRPMPNAIVNVTPADAGPNAKPVGVQADDQGIFMIKGLSTGKTYTLSVRAEDRGRVLGGVATAQAPNTKMLIRLSEGPAQPKTAAPSVAPAPAPATDKPEQKDSKSKLADPPTSSIPSPDPVSNDKDPLTEGRDQSYGPGKKPPPVQPYVPPPPPSNNPNITENKSAFFKPPTVAIGSGAAPAIVEPPPPPATPSMSAVPSNSSPLTGGPVRQPPARVNVTLYDSAANPIEFKNLSDRRLIVLDFWSTTCMPCLRKIPELVDLQYRYANYVEVVGIACDDLPWEQRKKAVNGIKDYYLRKTPRPINYGILFEGDGQEGRVQSMFKIKAYPTMILVDHKGQELWRGSDVRQLEESVRYYLTRK